MDAPSHWRLVPLLLGLLAAAPAGADPPVVAAASNVVAALDDIHAEFRSSTGLKLRMAYGSSGNLTRQIEQGAPFDLFLSADEAFVERLAAAGLTRDEGTVYGTGRLVLFVPDGSPLAPDKRLEGVHKLLGQGGRWRLAVANPEHAPYGRAAVQAFRALGLWPAVESHLVLGESITQAAQFAASSASVGGIIAYALALTPELANRGEHVLIPAELHEPLRQRMVLLRNADPVAVRFHDYILGPIGQAILRQYGFETTP